MCVCVASQGGKAGAMQSCRTCGGRGIKVTMRQLGPGMVQQMQSVCPECRGEGLLMPTLYSLIKRLGLRRVVHVCDLFLTKLLLFILFFPFYNLFINILLCTFVMFLLICYHIFNPLICVSY